MPHDALASTHSIQSLLREARARLGNNFSAALDARLLLQEATGLSHAALIAAADREVGAEAVVLFNSYIARRLAHEPVSRIRGCREFYGRNFIITPDVLDPRPDTETVVELALRLCARGRFIDLGTGSGVIAVTLCAENKNLSGIASDASAAALGVAQANALAHAPGQSLSFHHAHWFDGVRARFELIISNPPYIRLEDRLMPEVLEYDPHLALFGGADGLDAYRDISAVAAAFLAPEGTVVVEVGAGQSNEITQLFEARGFMMRESAKDLQGHTRALAFNLCLPG